MMLVKQAVVMLVKQAVVMSAKKACNRLARGRCSIATSSSLRRVSAASFDSSPVSCISVLPSGASAMATIKFLRLRSKGRAGDFAAMLHGAKQ